MRSIERAQELGEVFTGAREVKAMLDLVPDMFVSLDVTFLEPACGHGNFLVEILARKIALISNLASQTEYEFALMRAIVSIYGVDISVDNVDEARSRLFEMIEATHAILGCEPSDGFDAAVRTVLSTNLVVGDSLARASEIVFVEYKPIDGFSFRRTPFHLEEPEIDLFYVGPDQLSTVHYLNLGA